VKQLCNNLQWTIEGFDPIVTFVVGLTWKLVNYGMDCGRNSTTVVDVNFLRRCDRNWAAPNPCSLFFLSWVFTKIGGEYHYHYVLIVSRRVRVHVIFEPRCIFHMCIIPQIIVAQFTLDPARLKHDAPVDTQSTKDGFLRA
jgi:hypothetical protein